MIRTSKSQPYFFLEGTLCLPRGESGSRWQPNDMGYVYLQQLGGLKKKEWGGVVRNRLGGLFREVEAQFEVRMSAGFRSAIELEI